LYCLQINKRSFKSTVHELLEVRGGFILAPQFASMFHVQ
jgi:hypothetical protein